MDLEELSRQVKAIQEKLDATANLAAQIAKSSTNIAVAHSSREVKIEAIIEVTISLVGELAEREGISPEEFQKHFNKRQKYYYDLGLQTVEDISPDRAAQIDSRTIAEAGEDEPYPPLFGE